MSKIQPVVMPKWGLAMTEGKVVAWHTCEGAEISVGDDLLDIETTKITNVVESPVEGLLRRQVVPEGTLAPVGALLAIVADAAVPDAEIDAYIADFNANFEAKAAEAEEAAPEPQTVDAGGTTINYLRMGDAAQGDGGPPVVMIHGFGGDLNNWMFNQPMLAERHATLTLDLPGHGRSGKDVGSGDMAALSQTFGAFLDALDVERAHLVGHSMGGALALSFALSHPARVASLTVIAPGGLGREVNMDYIDGFVRAGRRKEMKEVLALLFADPSLVSRDMIEDVLKYKRLDGVDAALRTLVENLFPGGRQQTFPADALAGLAVPAQAIWGRNDKVIPAEHAKALPAAVKAHFLDDAGHMPHMEKAGEVNALIEGLTAG